MSTIQPIENGASQRILVRNGRIYTSPYSPSFPLIQTATPAIRPKALYSFSRFVRKKSVAQRQRPKRRANMSAVSAQARADSQPNTQQVAPRAQPNIVAVPESDDQAAHQAQNPSVGQRKGVRKDTASTKSKEQYLSKPASTSVISVESKVSKSRHLNVTSHAQASIQRRRKNVAFDIGLLRRPKGLSNPRHFCYRRSILQALFHQPAFLSWLEQCRNSHGQHTRNDICISCSLATLCSKVWASNGTTNREIANFDAALKQLARSNSALPWLSDHDQADANEALMFILNQLPRNLRTRQLFRLTSGSEWTCPDCLNVHTSRLVGEWGLSLGLETTRSTHINDIIATGFPQQSTEGMTCELLACKSKGTRTRTHTIFSAPDVLIVHLVRFSYNYDRARGRQYPSKNTKQVRYDTELDLSPYADPAALAGGPLKYRLQALVAHQGTLEAGHYVAYCRGPGGVSLISDSDVSASNEARMLAPTGGFQPYILFYSAV